MGANVSLPRNINTHIHVSPRSSYSIFARTLHRLYFRLGTGTARGLNDTPNSVLAMSHGTCNTGTWGIGTWSTIGQVRQMAAAPPKRSVSRISIDATADDFTSGRLEKTMCTPERESPIMSHWLLRSPAVIDNRCLFWKL